MESWHPCPPLPGKISINIGDPLQFMSDGLLKSNYHRVRMPKAGEPGENKVRPRTLTLILTLALTHMHWHVPTGCLMASCVMGCSTAHRTGLNAIREPVGDLGRRVLQLGW